MAKEWHPGDVLTDEDVMTLIAEGREKGLAERKITAFAEGDEWYMVLGNESELEAKKPASMYSSFTSNLKRLKGVDKTKYGEVHLKRKGDLVFLYDLTKKPATTEAA